MSRFLFLFIIIAFTNTILGQDFEFENNSLLFQDRKTNLPVLIVQDSILLKGNPLKKIKFNHTAYPGKLYHYLSYSIQGKTYLVHDGSGPVLEYRNDSIVNCNKTSLFQNQIGSAKFVYENELYLFGGYGLFTYKNILTKYDAPNKDWIQIQTFGEAAPSPRARFYSYRVNENVYIFGGDEEDPCNFPNYKSCDNTVWRLHLPSMHWYKIGKFDSRIIDQNSFLSFSANDKLYLISISDFGTAYEVDIIQNKVRKFTTKTLIKPTQIYYDSAKKKLVCITALSNGKYKFFQTDLITFLGKPNYESTFIMPSYKALSTATSSFSLLILCIAIGIIIYTLKNKKNSLLNFNGIVYKKDSDNCYYKNKPINNLEEPELRILLYLIKNNIRYIALIELNRLFENTNYIENFTSMVKRRELTMASLVYKLTNLTNLPEEQVLLYRKNPEDKRIKEIKIAPSFLRIK